MAPEYSSSRIHVEEIGARAIVGASTSVAAFIGWAAEGPSDRAVPCLTLDDYTATFGPLDPRSYLGYAVSHFFLNGGKQAWVIRVTQGADAAAETSALEPGSLAFSAALMGDDTRPAAYKLLERADPFDLLAVPGHSIDADLKTLQQFCRANRTFLIIDCAPGATFDSLEQGPSSVLTGDDAANSAIYFPWIQAQDREQGGRLRFFPPSGAVAGIYARTDAARGVWKAPAGAEAAIAGATGVQHAVTTNENGVLNRLAINCIRDDLAHGTVLWGARTLRGNDASADEWKYIPVRRTALYIEQSLIHGLKWTLFEANEEPLWGRIRLSVETFMHELFRKGAFQATRPSDAYFVKCGTDTTTQEEIDRGIVNITVGFAALKPAEFVIISIAQLAGGPRTSPPGTAAR